MTTTQTTQLEALVRQLRADSLRSATHAGSGHPTSSLSAVELMAVLMSKYLRYDFDAPKNPNNDRLVFSKGHASPLIYAMYKAAGAISDEELLSFRKFSSPFEGHPTPVIPWIDVATGSLGQGLPFGVGMALAGKYLEKRDYRVWVVCGDSEMAEGSMWEAFDKASHYRLSNLTAILDMNRLGQRGPTALEWDAEAYAARAQAFGWHTVSIDGHNLDEIDRAYAEATEKREQPTLIVARTKKGAGISFLADQEGWHGKPLPEDKLEQALGELGDGEEVRIEVTKPAAAEPEGQSEASKPDLPRYDKGAEVATRQAFGEALRAVGDARGDVVALDGEVGNSTHTDIFAKAHPERFFQMYIAEQQMIAAAVGLSTRGYVPFAATFGAFLTRAYDFIRMAAVSRVSIRLCGSHAGVAIGEDGPSQMGLEDLAMMRAVHASTVLYPCDANQTAKLTAAMADLNGISYLRTSRGKMKVLYAPDEDFPVGGSKTLRRSDGDRVTVVAAGVTVHEALAACDKLEADGIKVRLIDAYSVKPVDGATLAEAVAATGGRLVVAEDHWPEGGLGEAVLSALHEAPDLPKLAFRHLAVREMPGSGTPAELLAAAGIDAEAIAKAVRDLAG
jgi:transketolase